MRGVRDVFQSDGYCVALNELVSSRSAIRPHVNVPGSQLFYLKSTRGIDGGRTAEHTSRGDFRRRQPSSLRLNGVKKSDDAHVERLKKKRPREKNPPYSMAEVYSAYAEWMKQSG